MKTVEYFAMWLAVLADDFCFMRHDAAFVLADGREEVEAMNPGITLDNKVLFATIFEVVPEEPPDRMTL